MLGNVETAELAATKSSTMQQELRICQHHASLAVSFHSYFGNCWPGAWIYNGCESSECEGNHFIIQSESNWISLEQEVLITVAYYLPTTEQRCLPPSRCFDFNCCAVSDHSRKKTEKTNWDIFSAHHSPCRRGAWSPVSRRGQHRLPD